jgi:Zn-dependent protease
LTPTIPAVRPIELLTADPPAFVVLALSLVGALTLHEFAHALAADLQGDRLPRAMGRLSLNPIHHLDPLGTIAILLVGFGWAKPVEFRPQALTSKRFGAALVALAGPLMNLALAFGAGFVLRGAGDLAPQFVREFLIYFLVINAILAVFNLIPLPPLDGSRLLTIFLPPEKQRVIFFLDRYGFLILLALVFLAGDWLFRLIQPVINAIVSISAG